MLINGSTGTNPNTAAGGFCFMHIFLSFLTAQKFTGLKGEWR